MSLLSALFGFFFSKEGRNDQRLEREEIILKHELQEKKAEIKQERRLEHIAKAVLNDLHWVERKLKRVQRGYVTDTLERLEKQQKFLQSGEYSPRDAEMHTREVYAEVSRLFAELRPLQQEEKLAHEIVEVLKTLQHAKKLLEDELEIEQVQEKEEQDEKELSVEEEKLENQSA